MNKDITCPSSEFSQKFVDGMIKRMGVSYHKYGPVSKAYPHKVNAIKSLELRLKKYKEDGNLEHLIDAANYCMIEFMFPSNDEAFFKATDSNKSPGRVWQSGGPPNKKNNDGER